MWGKNSWCLGLIFLILLCNFVGAVCDWKVEVLSKDFFQNASEFRFRYKISKINGDKTNVTLIRNIEDVSGNIVKSYDNYTKEIYVQHTTPYLTPNLNPGTYLIKGEIFPDCEDINLSNNYAEKQVIINDSYIKNYMNNCDWQIKILLNKYIFEESKDVNWTVKVSRIKGDKTNISVRGYVKDLITNWQISYKPWTNESITNYRNKQYSPNLYENKFYEIFFNITEISCNDTDLENNFDYKFIMVLPFELGSDYTKIRISELFPDPEGYDNAAMPEGEWIELYNSGDEFLDLENLSFKDNYGESYDIFISDSNTINGTIIKPKGYLVVYMNGVTGFLNNDGFEKIGLYKNDYLIDEVSYSGSIEGLSWGKIGNEWKLTLPTPNSANIYNESINNSILKIEDINKEKFKFGEIIKIKVYVYKGHTERSSIQAWVEDRDGNRVSEKTKILIYNKFSEHNLEIPLQTFSNCNGDYKEGEYKVVLEGFGLRDEKEIEIKGNTKDACKIINKEIVREKSSELTGLSEKNINTYYNIEYISKEVKERRLAIYFFCLILVFMLIYFGLKWSKEK